MPHRKRLESGPVHTNPEENLSEDPRATVPRPPLLPQAAPESRVKRPISPPTAESKDILITAPSSETAPLVTSPQEPAPKATAPPVTPQQTTPQEAPPHAAPSPAPPKGQEVGAAHPRETPQKSADAIVSRSVPTPQTTQPEPQAVAAMSSHELSENGRRTYWIAGVLILICLGGASLYFALRPQFQKNGVPTPLKPYYQKAKAGDPSAMHMLGVMYYHGLNVPQDRVKGLEWYRKAAVAGSKTAREELAQMGVAY